jgi:hypothetical protein
MNRDFVFDEFKMQIEKKGLKIDSVDNTGLIYITVRGTQLKVSLDNVRRDFERDHDTTVIAHYAIALDDAAVDMPSSWNEVRNHIYISLFPSDYDFDKFVHESVTDSVMKIYVFSTPGNFMWIDKSDLIKWKVSESEMIKQAKANGDSLLSKSKITFDTIEDHKLGMLETEDETLKAALLFAPSMKEKAKKVFGFPFYVVIPVRDFCYLFSEKDFNFFSKKLGPTVIEEYQKSGHPITTEILKFTDQGVEAVGRYRTSPKTKPPFPPLFQLLAQRISNAG